LNPAQSPSILAAPAVSAIKLRITRHSFAEAATKGQARSGSAAGKTKQERDRVTEKIGTALKRLSRLRKRPLRLQHPSEIEQMESPAGSIVINFEKFADAPSLKIEAHAALPNADEARLLLTGSQSDHPSD
jgi:hypothetical protein